MSDFPRRIWLQWTDEDATVKPEYKFKDCEEVTWCVDKQFAHDIEYIRADLAAARERELVEALEAAEPLYATANNTSSVRSGHEMSGYVKHYKIPPHVLHKALGLDKHKEQSND